MLHLFYANNDLHSFIINAYMNFKYSYQFRRDSDQLEWFIKIFMHKNCNINRIMKR